MLWVERADLTRRTLCIGAEGLTTSGRYWRSWASGRKEAAEGDLWSWRGGDGEAARLLVWVPPDTLREEREEVLSGWSWFRLNGNCALTLTIFLLGVVDRTGGREWSDRPFFGTDNGAETLLELLVVDHAGLWAAGGERGAGRRRRGTCVSSEGGMSGVRSPV